MNTEFLFLRCPSCESRLRVSSEKRDKLVKCPTCKTVFKIAAVPEAPDPKNSRGPGEPSRKPVLRFQTMVIDAPSPHDEHYWAQQDSNSHSDSKQLSSGGRAPQPVRRHPGREVTKVIVNTRPMHVVKPKAYRKVHQQSAVDEALTAGGIIMILIGVAVGLFPLMQVRLGWFSYVDLQMPATGAVFCLLGFVILIVANRSRGLAALGVITAFGVLTTVCIATFSVLTSPNQTAGNQDLSTARSVDTTSPAGENINSIANATTTKRNKDGATIEPVDGEGAEVNLGTNHLDEPVSDADSVPSGSDVEIEEHWNPFLVNPASKNVEKKKPMGNFKPGAKPKPPATTDPYDSDSKKLAEPKRRLTEFKTRTVSQMVGRWKNGPPTTSGFDRDVVNSMNFAGQVTPLGRVMESAQPLIGVDFTQQFKSTHLTPIFEGEGQMPQSIVLDGYLLAGLNLAFKNEKIVAVQGIFASSTGFNLHIPSKKIGEWLGDPNNATSFEKLMSTGPFVKGIVVYRRNEQVQGVGLVISNTP